MFDCTYAKQMPDPWQKKAESPNTQKDRKIPKQEKIQGVEEPEKISGLGTKKLPKSQLSD